MYKKLKLVESASDRYQVREYDGPGAKFGVYDTKAKKFVQKGSKKVMTAACNDLNNKNKKLKESSTEEYRYITTHGIGPGMCPEGTFIRSEDLGNYKTAIYLNRPLTSEELKKYDIKPEWIQESTKLTEDLDDEEIEDKAAENEENQEELEDTINSEEDQEENPVEEESELDKELNELRDILVDLDLNLYQITDKEDLNNSIYIIGKVAENSADVLMLVDTKPEEVNSEEIPDEEPIINNVDIDDNIEEDEETDVEVEDTEKESELEQRFDFVKLPNTFEEVNKLNPRYGEELTPDHEAVMEYLMNCLIEINPEAAEELQKEEEPEETPMEEPDYDVNLDIDIDGEEDLENEDEY